MYSANVLEQLDTSFFAEAFSGSLSLPLTLEPNFEDALRYVLGNPGSLIRPKLVYQMATAYGLDPGPAQKLAIALEYFHTASLLFDDLPCMDNATERRGALCTHIAFGEEGAILTALALINRAYALTWRAVAGCPEERQERAMSFIEGCLGVGGLLNGQSFDLHYATLPRTLETTERIAQGKTVSLIRLTLALPAMLGGASARELQQIERISVFWGLGYQIVDDLKDVLQSSVQIGKDAVARCRTGEAEHCSRDRNPGRGPAANPVDRSGRQSSGQSSCQATGAGVSGETTRPTAV